MDLPCIERLLLAIFCCFLGVVSSQQATNSDYQTYRTGYHFQPLKNWMNDPSGPMIYKGVYHLFYQYMPEGVLMGKRVWAHSTSSDMINWTPQGIALPRSTPSDINGSWTGSTTILTTYKPAILYTGITANNEQVQNLATPKNILDPNLVDWVKYPHNPVMAPTLANHINSSSFRDPTTAWLPPDGQWRVVVGNKRDRVGMALLYRSTDFVHWVEADHPLHSVDGNGMWECPDFYPVYVNLTLGADTSALGSGVKHVLKVSLDDTRREYYTLGMYDVGRDVYIPNDGSIEDNSGLRYDYGKFYASKTFFDSAKSRRVLWAWINESSSDEDNVKKGWAGIQAIPRTVLLDTSGKQLVHWPIKEVEMLRENPVNVPEEVIQGGSTSEITGVTALQADVEISFKVGDLTKAEELEAASMNDPQQLCSEKGASVSGAVGPFGLLVLASKGLEEYTAVFFRVFKTASDGFVVLLCSDQSRSSLNPTTDKTTYGTFVRMDPASEELSLRTLIDHSIVESFAARGKSCITARVYPTLAIDNDDARLYVFNNGTESVNVTRLSAWSMKTAQIS